MTPINISHPERVKNPAHLSRNGMIMTFKRTGRTIQAALLVLAGGCSHPGVNYTDPGYRIISEFAASLPDHVSFDPYSATLHFDRREINRLFETTQIRLHQSGCGRADPWPSSGWEEDDFIKHRAVNVYNIQNDAWKAQLYKQLETSKDGWAIVQIDYPQAGLQHGDFSVKSLIVFNMQWCGIEKYGPQPSFHFTVRNRNTQKAPSPSPAQTRPQAQTEPRPAAGNPGRDVADSTTRLRRLKEMHDAGLIDKKEFEDRKKIILDSL